MKKEYIAPTSSCHIVQLGSMIAESRFTTGQENQNVTVTEETTNEFTSRRRHSQWDDEEEEDYSF